jgi:hypothetical protein
MFARTAQSRLFAQPWHSLVRDCGYSLPPTLEPRERRSTDQDGRRCDRTRVGGDPLRGRDPRPLQEKTFSERFRSPYKEAELQEWVPKVEHLAKGARDVHVLWTLLLRLRGRQSPASSWTCCAVPTCRWPSGPRRSLGMSVHAGGDPEGCQGQGGSRAWWRRAAARLTGPARPSTPIARLRKVAMTSRAVPVRSWEASSA